MPRQALASPSSSVDAAAPRRGLLLSRTILATAVVSGFVLGACQSADAATSAADPQPPAPLPAAAPGLSGTVGLGVGSTPTYEGSDRRRTVAVPTLELAWRTADWGTVSLDTQGLAWQFLEVEGLRLSALGAIDPGRKVRRPSALDPAPGDDRLAGMGPVHASAELGAGLGYGPVQLSVLRAVGSRGTRGTLATLGGELPWAATSTLTLTAGAAATWADRKYLQAYFGVTPAQSAATGFAAYAPKSGLQKVEFDLGADYALTRDLHLKAGVGVERLAGDAADSPLVQRRTGVSGRAGVAYGF